MTPSLTFRNLPPGKQERILDEALSEFADKGYARAALNPLVGRLGISNGSIFQYFRDKSGLLSQVFDFAVGRVQGPSALGARIQQRPGRLPSPGVEPHRWLGADPGQSPPVQALPQNRFRG